MTAAFLAQLQVLINRELGKNFTVFRHIAQTQVRDFVGFFALDVLSFPIDAAWAIEQNHDGFGGGGAARAVAAQQGDDLALCHTEAGVRSGGEQQMLTLCRTLMGDPDLIIIDEPTEGLAPKIVELVGQYLQELKSRGISVLLIEQKLTIAMNISDRALVMGHGSIVFEGTPEALRQNTYIRKEWLEV